MTVARCRVGVAAQVCVSERRLGRTRKCEGAGQSLGDARRRHPSCLEIEDTGNASSCTFSTLQHGILEPASCMTRQAASKEAQRWNLRTRPRLGRKKDQAQSAQRKHMADAEGRKLTRFCCAPIINAIRGSFLSFPCSQYNRCCPRL